MDGVEDGALVGELDLRLGGVDVDVHGGGVELEVYDAGREAPGEQGAAIGLLDGGLEQLALYVPAVHEEILRAPAAAPGGGRARKAADPHRLAVEAGGDGQHGAGEVAAEQGVHRALRAAVAGGEELLAAVAYAAHGDVGAAQGAAQRRREAGRALGPVALQELAPGGRVVEEAAHGDARALGRAGLVHLADVAGVEAHVRALARAALAGGELDVRDAGDGGQGLAAEAERAYALEAALVGELAGGVAQEGDPGVLGGHPAAVVGHADELRAAAGEFYRYVARPGVHGVLNELLHRRGRALHHLARRNQVGDVGGEYVYSGHDITSFAVALFLLLYFKTVELSRAK